MANTLAIITGCSRGLGLELSKLVLTSKPPLCCSQYINNGQPHKYSVLCVTARTQEGLDECMKELKSIRNTQCSIFPMLLDVTDEDSISTFTESISNLHTPIGALVNNAGVFKKGWNPSAFQANFDTNLFGLYSLTESIIPLLENSSRIINLSSSKFGIRSSFPISTQRWIEQVQTKENLISLTFPEDDDARKDPTALYRLTKALVNNYTMMLSSDKSLQERQISTLSVCPGFCKTDMGTKAAPQTPEEGANSIYWALSHPIPCPSGKLYSYGQAKHM